MLSSEVLKLNSHSIYKLYYIAVWLNVEAADIFQDHSRGPSNWTVGHSIANKVHSIFFCCKIAIPHIITSEQLPLVIANTVCAALHGRYLAVRHPFML